MSDNAELVKRHRASLERLRDGLATALDDPNRGENFLGENGANPGSKLAVVITAGEQVAINV